MSERVRVGCNASSEGRWWGWGAGGAEEGVNEKRDDKRLHLEVRSSVNQRSDRHVCSPACEDRMVICTSHSQLKWHKSDTLTV